MSCIATTRARWSNTYRYSNVLTKERSVEQLRLDQKPKTGVRSSAFVRISTLSPVVGGKWHFTFYYHLSMRDELRT